MLTTEEQKVVDRTIKDLSQCDEFDVAAQGKILQDFENSLPQGKLKDFIEKVDTTLGKYLNYDEEDWEDEDNLDDAIAKFKMARKKFNKNERPQFLPREIARAYKHVVENAIDELELMNM